MTDTTDTGLTTEPVRKTVTVPLSPAEAFAAFTDEASSWWPLATHSVAGDDAVGVVFEPHVGGHIVESARDGSTCTWGTVTAWEPGVRFACTWHPGLSPDEATDLEVAFAAAPGGCEVVLVHSGWERRSGGAEMRARYGVGWDFVLGKYTASQH